MILDAALGASSLSWSLVQPRIAEFTGVCAYDRAGFAWSDAGPMPRTAGRIADELRALLERACVRPPYVLVGHSFGGLVMRLFAARHREDVAALVLIEPAIVEEWAAAGPDAQVLIARGARLCRYGATAARLGIARLVAALTRIGALGAARALVRVVSRGGLRREDEGILAPIWKLPHDARGLLGSMWAQPKFFEALGSQIQHVCDSAAEVLREEPASFGDLPLVVLTATSAGERRLHADNALASRSTRGRHLLVPESGHWVPLDAPESVTQAIAEVVEAAR